MDLPSPRRRPQLNIRTRIAWLVVACLLPAWAGTGFFTYQAYRHQLARVEEGTQSSATGLMLIIERELAAIAAAMQALSTSPSLDQQDRAAFYTQAETVLHHSRGLNILWIAPDGQQIVNTSRPLNQRLPKEPLAEHMRKVMVSHQPVVTNLFYGPVVKRMLVAVVVPVLRGDQLVGFLSMSLDAGNLAQIVTQQHFPPGWEAAVLDARGTLITRTQAADRYVGQKAVPEFLAAIAEAPRGLVSTTSHEGAALRVAFQRSATHDWVAAVAVPERQLTADLRQTLLLQLVGAAALLAAGLALANRLSHRIAAPIQALVAPALALGRGEPLQIDHQDLAEAEAVGQALLATQALLQERERERDAAQTLSYTDGLTGLANRRRFDLALALEFQRQQRTGSPLSLILLDVDHFKRYNDHYGHPAGDHCLQAVAQVLREQVNRVADMAARYGGEEFVCLLPDTDLAGAQQLAETLREGVAQLQLPHNQSDTAPHLTISLGVVCSQHTPVHLAADLLRSTDAALYRAKHLGRNRVVVGEAVATNSVA